MLRVCTYLPIPCPFTLSMFLAIQSVLSFPKAYQLTGDCRNGRLKLIRNRKYSTMMRPKQMKARVFYDHLCSFFKCVKLLRAVSSSAFLPHNHKAVRAVWNWGKRGIWRNVICIVSYYIMNVSNSVMLDAVWKRNGTVPMWRLQLKWRFIEKTQDDSKRASHSLCASYMKE